jgi:hypothetical protein
MTLENIEQKELSPGEREVLSKDRQRWQQMGLASG